MYIYHACYAIMFLILSMVNLVILFVPQKEHEKQVVQFILLIVYLVFAVFGFVTLPH